MFMIGMSITFNKQVASTPDAMGNPTHTVSPITIDDCLVAPISEPATAREQQAMEQSRDQVRVHFPKLDATDVSDSDFVYGGKTFHLDSDSVVFMDGNTPTRWNRYIRAECIN